MLNIFYCLIFNYFQHVKKQISIQLTWLDKWLDLFCSRLNGNLLNVVNISFMYAVLSCNH